MPSEADEYARDATILSCYICRQKQTSMQETLLYLLHMPSEADGYARDATISTTYTVSSRRVCKKRYYSYYICRQKQTSMLETLL